MGTSGHEDRRPDWARQFPMHGGGSLSARWKIDLLGGLRAMQDSRAITRFQTHKTGVLLAYLAFYCNRSHPREVLTEMLWPEDDLDRARHKLSMALSSLRRQFELPGVPTGTVIVANRAAVQLNTAAITTDVAEFEASLEAASIATSSLVRAQHFEEAVDQYRGELLPGYFEEWVLQERQRLSEAYLKALGELMALREPEGDLSGAVEWARRAVTADPLQEEAHYELMRLLVAAGKPQAALRQYRQLERVLEAELGTVPGAGSRNLARFLEQRAASNSHEDRKTRIDTDGPIPSNERWRVWEAAATSADQFVPSASGDAPSTLPSGTVTLLLSRWGIRQLWRRGLGKGCGRRWRVIKH
jgi:DNA-binding SARP family transcriptional activator